MARPMGCSQVGSTCPSESSKALWGRPLTLLGNSGTVTVLTSLLLGRSVPQGQCPGRAAADGGLASAGAAAVCAGSSCYCHAGWSSHWTLSGPLSCHSCGERRACHSWASRGEGRSGAGG